MDAFAALLEHVAIQANPVYRHSVKLAELAADLRSTPIHAENTRRLAAFLKHNTSMHLEGYAAFRMRTFKEKLDMMTYTLIKKIRLSER